MESQVGSPQIQARLCDWEGHKRFIECTVTDFHGSDGWELVSTEDEEEVHMITFEDFVTGRVQLA